MMALLLSLTSGTLASSVGEPSTKVLLPFPLVSNAADVVVIDTNLLALLYRLCGRNNDCCAFERGGFVISLSGIPLSVGLAAMIEE